jgi:hypothetical protein
MNNARTSECNVDCIGNYRAYKPLTDENIKPDTHAELFIGTSHDKKLAR